MEKDDRNELFGRFAELTIKTKDLANELTNHNVTQKCLTHKTQIAKERIENYAALQNVLLQRGVNLKISYNRRPV
jgi:hypothetical protein